MTPACPHAERDVRGGCTACGHCLHGVILNGACVYCGATEIDPVAVSPKVIPVDRLTRKK